MEVYNRNYNTNNNYNTSRGGIGFFGLLTLLFIALKLTGYIAWSWFWVLSPLWIGILLIILLIGLFAFALTR